MSNSDDQEGAPRPRDARGWRRRPGLLAGFAGLLALTVGAASSVGLLLWAESKVDRVPVEGIRPVGERGERLEGFDDPDLDLEDVVNVLVVGSDAREGLTREQRRELGTGDADGERTDTIMLVRLDPKQDAVSLLSFPRDLLVSRCDGSRGRINAAFQIGEQTGVGGPTCLVQTITEFSGLPVHHYVAVDFPGFIELVELVGGVNVYLEHAIDDWRANLDLPAGCNRLDGETALGFARHRASDSDYGRVARQQRLVKELIHEATRLGNLLNVPRALRMIDTAAEAVQTDQDLSIDLMRRIAFTFRELDGGNVTARTVPGDFQTIDGIAFEVPIEDEVEQLFAAFQSGTMHPEPEEHDSDAAEAKPALAPEDIPLVTILNAAGVSGLASEARAMLEAEGFGVAGIDNADDMGQATTEIRHPAGLADEAELLAGQFPGAELAPVHDSDGIVVVLGTDYDPNASAERGDEGGAPVDEDEDALPPPPANDQEFVGAQPPPVFCHD